MNEVRSTNELAVVKQRARGQTKLIVLLQEVKETEQASLMGYVTHTLRDAYDAAIERLIDGLASCRSGSKLRFTGE
jgi:hypothetical protein